MSLPELVLAAAIGLVAGAFAGLLGVGGGIVMVPAMVLLLGEDQHVAQGTSLLVIVATAAAGSVANARRGLLDLRLAAVVAAGGVAGAVGGALLATEVLDADTLRRIFGGVLLAIGARLLLRARAREPDPGVGAGD